MAKNLLVAQSGGPSAAINATLSGIIEVAMKSDKVGRVFGGCYGIEGILKGQIIDISSQITCPKDLDLLQCTPGMALHTCRFKMPSPQKDPEPYQKLVTIFTKLNIGYFIYIGGNDSMETALQMHLFTQERGLDIKCMGCPKTIDNDLPHTDHTPGFGSALKYVATSITEIFSDINSYGSKSVCVVEIMGRDAGWLTAGSGVAKICGGAPHLIYVPEKPFLAEECVASVKELHKTVSHVVIAVSEGIRGKDGKYVFIDPLAQGAVDAFGHVQLSGSGRYVESLIKKEIGCRVRLIEFSVLQRGSGHIASAEDLDESREVGKLGAQLALSGVSGKMAAIERLSADQNKETGEYEYKSRIVPVDLELVAGKVRQFPVEWILPDNSGLTQAGLDYFLPLLTTRKEVPMCKGLPIHFCFEKKYVELPK